MSFTLRPTEIAEEIADQLRTPGAHLSSHLETYERPDRSEAFLVHDPVDRAVIVFVGSRRQASDVFLAARLALGMETDGGD